MAKIMVEERVDLRRGKSKRDNVLIINVLARG